MSNYVKVKSTDGIDYTVNGAAGLYLQKVSDKVILYPKNRRWCKYLFPRRLKCKCS